MDRYRDLLLAMLSCESSRQLRLMVMMVMDFRPWRAEHSAFTVEPRNGPEERPFAGEPRVERCTKEFW